MSDVTGTTELSLKRAHLQTLQILRFAAAFSVVLYHFGSGLSAEFGFSSSVFSFGYAGVDVFFVLSGFIISYTNAPQSDPITFMRKRAARVVPLYWLLTALVIAVATFFPRLLNSTTVDAESIVKSFLFIPYEKDNGAVQPLLFLGWTLCYEMFFYLIFSISLISRKWTTLNASIALIGIAYAGAIWPGESPLWQFFTNPIILEFVFGMLLCEVFLHTDRQPKIPYILAVLMLTATIVLFALSRDMPRFIGHGVPATMIVAIFLFLLVPSGRILSFLVLLGDASYALYLLHPYILQMPIKIVSKYADFGVTTLVTMAAIPAAIFASIFLFWFVEKPAQRWLLRYNGNRQLISDTSPSLRV